MKADNLKTIRRNRAFLSAAACDLNEFRALVERRVDLADYPFASEAPSNVLIYEAATVLAAEQSPETRLELMAEWAEALMDGPGVMVLRGAFPDTATLDRASDVFREIVAQEKAAHVGGGDHFAKPGANDRIWNALQKLCLRDPETFALYYANPTLALVSQAWLGPHYQVTSQVNVVNPGGAAQTAHRDYHLGFQSTATAERTPAHVHRLSPALTLQGAVAHSDMPVETGPTLYLPFSQTYVPGYLATSRPDFQAYFDERHVQLPLAKGDAVFFNPALFHAAGHNRSAHVRRMANLLQVSSPYGRAMESLDRRAMSAALYPALLRLQAQGRIDPAQTANAVAACAEGYSFPTNLDSDPPLGGLAPRTDQALMLDALATGQDPAAFEADLAAQSARRRP